MEIRGTIIGTRLEQDTGSSHLVYVLDGDREIHTVHGSTSYAAERLPSVEDEVVVDVDEAPNGLTYARRIEVVQT